MDSALFTSYRVVCSRSLQNPEHLFVDICRDGFCSHDLLFKMQQKFYHNDELELLFRDSRGIILREGRDGTIHLVYTKHRDKMAQLAQEKLRARVDPQIIKRFKEMKDAGKFQTISVQIRDIRQVVKTPALQNQPVQCLDDEKAQEETQREKRLQQLKKIKNDFYARQAYASTPHLLLKLKQQERSGD